MEPWSFKPASDIELSPVETCAEPAARVGPDLDSGSSGLATLDQGILQALPSVEHRGRAFRSD